MERVYLDYAATSYIKDEVFEKMEPYLKGSFGNASAVYKSGREAREAVSGARKSVARLLGAGKKDNVVFTSGRHGEQ
jgi:cysteine desulfurase